MSLYRFDPPVGSRPLEGFVRAGVDGPVVCDSCGCRLEPPGRISETAEPAGEWRHFEGLPGRDARGCRVDCVDLAHGRDGRVLAELAAV
jgi:hypothetical protein